MIRTHYWFEDPYDWFRDREPADGDYFVFTEEVEFVEATGMLGPDGEPITIPGPTATELRRFRTSGISALDFLDIADNFDVLDPDAVGNAQRKKRRADLVENLANVPLPLLDLYVPGDHHELPLIAATLSPGSWYLMGVRRRRIEDSRLSVFVGAPELPPSPYRPGSLEVLAAIPPNVHARLRDIFSLAHVPDAGIEGLGGGEPPPPDKPRRGGEDWIVEEPYRGLALGDGPAPKGA